jgi:hypothetical protein
MMVLFVILAAVALLQCIGIFGCGWPMSSRVLLEIIPFWQFRNNALVVDATTNHKIEHSV